MVRREEERARNCRKGRGTRDFPIKADCPNIIGIHRQEERGMVSSLFLLWLYMAQRIGPGGYPQCLIVNVSIDLRSIQMLMAQYLLDCSHIHAVLQHQRSGGMTKLVGRVLGAVESGGA